MVTLDADTKRLLRSAMRERNVSFQAALNDAIRRGLRTRSASGAEPPFTTTAKPMQLRADLDAPLRPGCTIWTPRWRSSASGS